MGELLGEGGLLVWDVPEVLDALPVSVVWPEDHQASHSASVQASADGDPVSQKALPVLPTAWKMVWKQV